MATLTGTSVKNTYTGLIKTNDNGARGAEGSADQCSDGAGNTIPLFVSATEVYATGSNAGDDNTAFGKLAGVDLASGGDDNTFLGSSAGQSITTGDSNVAIGYQALDGSLLAGNCVAVGVGSLSGVITAGAAGAVGVGKNALSSLTSGAGNTAVGYQAGNALTTGANNVAIGYEALLYGTTETDDNIAIGFNCMSANFSTAAVNDCVAIGSNALLGTLTADASGSVAIGVAALTANTSGAKNTALGFQAGNTVTNGDDNTVIGYDADTSEDDSNNQTVIGSQVTGVADNAVTLGNSSVKHVYMAQDSGATVHCGAVVHGLAALVVTSVTLAYGTHSISKGKYLVVTADAQTLVLPAVQIGAVFIIVNGGADGGSIVTIDPDNGDKFLTNIAGGVGTDGNNISNTKATSNQGDFVKLVGASADGWAITEIGGIWADE